jgi:hypothetical protein
VRTQLTDDDLAGRTIEGIVEMRDEVIVLLLSGNAYLGFEGGYASDDKAPVERFSARSPTSSYLHDYEAQELFEATLWNAEDFAAWKERDDAKNREYEARRIAEREAKERSEYERLRLKFGD